MNGKVRIGVAGAGKMGSVHIKLLNELPGVYEFAGAYDPVLERANIAKRYGGKAYTSYDELLSEVDAVVIACPTSLHKDMALLAADKGVHALVEKPAAEKLEDANKMFEAFEKKNLVMSVSHVERFNPVARAIADLIKPIDIVSIEIHRCSPFDSRIFDVDVVADLMIHDIDILLNSFIGEAPAEIRAIGKKVFGGRFVDYAQASMKFSNGVIAFLTSSRCTEDKIRTICVHAKGAYIEGDLLRRTLTINRGVTYDEKSDNPRIDYTQSNLTQQVVLINQNPLREELEDFGKAILNGTKPLIKGPEVIRSMKVLDEVESQLYKEEQK